MSTTPDDSSLPSRENSSEKLKLAFYWAASCGGCEIAILEIGEKLLQLIEHAEIVFWPCIADFKYADLRGYPDNWIDVCFFNGAIRSSENEELAHLLRAKSKLLLAFGSCATEGCIPGLANLYTKEEILDCAFVDSPSTDNPSRVVPQPRTRVDGHELRLPELWNTVCTLDDVVAVDYSVPGCPPTEKTTWAAIETLLSGSLPPSGSLLGAGEKSVCDECRYEKRDTPIRAFRRPHLVRPRDDQCLLEQGLVCLGPATRSGCEARCPEVSQGCRGCYGPAGAAQDQGMEMLGALGSLVAGSTEQEIQQTLDQIVDPAGTFYRFSLARSTLRRKKPPQPCKEGKD